MNRVTQGDLGAGGGKNSLPLEISPREREPAPLMMHTSPPDQPGCQRSYPTVAANNPPRISRHELRDVPWSWRLAPPPKCLAASSSLRPRPRAPPPAPP